MKAFNKDLKEVAVEIFGAAANKIKRRKPEASSNLASNQVLEELEDQERE